jgi:hypothetical protein
VFAFGKGLVQVVSEEHAFGDVEGFEDVGVLEFDVLVEAALRAELQEIYP